MTRKPKLFALLTSAALLPIMSTAPAKADAQRAQAQANFQAADVNQDQVLDASEFKTFINLNADHNLGRASMIRRFGLYGRAFGTVDANADGVVSKQEIAARAQK